MPIVKGLEWTFNTNAKTYEKIRPKYVPELYKDIFSYIAIDKSSKVVEIGIGGGQATLPILKKGCLLTAVEYGGNLAKVCHEKFKDYINFSTVVDKFENVNFVSDSYDLVYSASAFHWIPEEEGYKKVFDMLKKGGAFARFSNAPYLDKGNLVLSNEIQNLYKKYYYTFHKKKYEAPKEYSIEDAIARANIASKYGFIDIEYKLYSRTRTFNAKQYIELLSTYSDHIAIDEDIRHEFFQQIELTINRFGGSITIYDTINLQLARKPN